VINRVFLPALIAAILLLPVPFAAAQEADLSKMVTIKTDNPRDTMRTFLTAMGDYREGVKTDDKRKKKRIDDAVACLNLEGMTFVVRQEKGREAAILLKEVIDRVIYIDYDKIPEDTGVGENQLLRWRLRNTEIVIARVETGDRAGEYLFTSRTVEQAPSFYERYKELPYQDGASGAGYTEPWIDRNVPEWAQSKVVLFSNWQWIGLFLAILLGLVVKTVAQHIVRGAKKITARSKMEWDDQIIVSIERPIGLIGAAAFWFFAIYALRFQGMALGVLNVIVQVTFSVGIIWALYNLTEVLTQYLIALTSRTESELDDHLAPMIRKALKILVIVFGTLVTFQNLGVNVVSVLAGLSIGGAAIAFAAKDTCAKVFGSIMIIIDRPFSIGDWIIADGVEGSVEEIGFWSTRVRTFYDSQISVPNSAMANANIDNMGRRKYRRIKAFFDLTYDTSPEQMEAFLEGLKNIVEANPYTRKDYYHVCFTAYGASGLTVMLYTFLKVPDWAAELVERQNIYLEILRLAKDLDVEFAYPSQSLYVESMPGQPKEKDVLKSDDLKQFAAGFGPNGERSSPGGQGVFTPPHYVPKSLAE
jgi:MscS family membrane protein